MILLKLSDSSRVNLEYILNIHKNEDGQCFCEDIRGNNYPITEEKYNQMSKAFKY